MRVLLANDDGVQSPGLLALKQALDEVAEVFVLAPDRNWSITGRTKTLKRPLMVTEVTLADGSRALACDGTPSDCVALGLLGLMTDRPDVVISGVNLGPNLADDITYSGTVAAAMEGLVAGVPSIAVSIGTFDDFDFRAAGWFAAQLARHVVEQPIGRDVLLNVNVPNLPLDRIESVEITRLGKRIYRDVLIREESPDGPVQYFIGGEIPGGEPEPGTDIWALAENRISVTPIHLDLTNHRLVEVIGHWELWRDLLGATR